jgi:hypothetical protein
MLGLGQNRRKMRNSLCVMLLLIAKATPVAANPVLQLSDMARIVDLEEPVISPDGTHVAVIAIAQDLAHA